MVSDGAREGRGRSGPRECCGHRKAHKACGSSRPSQLVAQTPNTRERNLDSGRLKHLPRGLRIVPILRTVLAVRRDRAVASAACMIMLLVIAPCRSDG